MWVLKLTDVMPVIGEDIYDRRKTVHLPLWVFSDKTVELVWKCSITIIIALIGIVVITRII